MKSPSSQSFIAPVFTTGCMGLSEAGVTKLRPASLVAARVPMAAVVYSHSSNILLVFEVFLISV